MNIAKRIASKVSLKERMRLLIILTVIPLTVMVLGIVAMIYNYSGSYNRIMANLKVINTYNMNFKSDMEYSMYRVMIGLINTKEFENGDILEGESQYATVVKNPFHTSTALRCRPCCPSCTARISRAWS